MDYRRALAPLAQGLNYSGSYDYRTLSRLFRISVIGQVQAAERLASTMHPSRYFARAAFIVRGRPSGAPARYLAS